MKVRLDSFADVSRVVVVVVDVVVFVALIALDRVLVLDRVFVFFRSIACHCDCCHVVTLHVAGFRRWVGGLPGLQLVFSGGLGPMS